MFYFALIFVAALSRFLPHPPNVVCLGALGLFAGCYLRDWRAFLIPLVVLFSTDLLGQFLAIPGMGFYNPITMAAVYAGALLAVPMGRVIGKIRENSPGSSWKFAGSVAGGSLVASTVFFLVSNFGVWMGGWYPINAAGLVSCFVSAIPFFGYTLVGDLFFSTLLFAGFETSRVTVSRRERATVRVRG